MSRTTNMYERKASNSFLAAVSDIGGFSYAFTFAVAALLSPYSAAAYTASIASKVKIASLSAENGSVHKVNGLRKRFD